MNCKAVGVEIQKESVSHYKPESRNRLKSKMEQQGRSSFISPMKASAVLFYLDIHLIGRGPATLEGPVYFTQCRNLDVNLIP